MPEEESSITTEYAVEFTREGETFLVPTVDATSAAVLVEAYAYDRDNENVKTLTRTVTEWAEEA